MASVDLATAYVAIVPSTKGFLDKVRAELGAPLEKTGRDAGKKLGDGVKEGVGDGVGDVAKKLAGAFAAVQVGSFLKGAVSAAADTAESVSKLTVLVGESADGLDEWAKTTGDAFGISRQEALSAAGTFATFFRGVGKSQQEAAGMSKDLVELAADLASFNNTSPEQAIEALGAALRGESEPIRAYGVLLDDATIKARAFSLGLTDSAKADLTPAIKLQAAYAEILAQTTDAQGDFARTSDGLAGSQKQLTAQFKDAQAALGVALLPAMSSAVQVAKDLLPAVAGLATTFADLAGAAAEAVIPVGGVLASFVTSDLGSAAITAGLVGKGVKEIGDAAKDAGTSIVNFAAGVNPALLGVSVAVGAAAALYFGFKKDAAEAKEQQDRLAEAFTNAADPAFVLAKQLTDVVTALKATKKETAGAADGVEALADPLNVLKELAPGVKDTLSKVGVGTDEIAKALTEGRIDELIGRVYEASKELDGTITDTQGFTRYADGVEDAALALERLGKNAEAARSSAAETIKNQLIEATNLGLLERATLDAAVAASTAADEQGRWLDVGAEFKPVLEGMAGATDAVVGAVDKVPGVTDPAADSTDDLAEAQKRAKDEAKKHEQALKDLSAAIDGFVDGTYDAVRADDEWTRSQNDLITAVRDRQADEDPNATATEGNSEAALDNREALRGAVELAQSQIDDLIAAGRPIEEITARASTLAAELVTNASNLGFSAPQIQPYEDAIQGIADTAAIANAQLGALPTELSVAITATMALDLEQYRAGLKEASKLFQDEMSAAYVEQGIIEVPGFQFALPPRAAGGPVKAGQAYWVGERGPEPFIPDVNGTIIANDKVSIGAGSGGPAVVINNPEFRANGSVAEMVDEVNTYLGWQLHRRNI